MRSSLTIFKAFFVAKSSLFSVMRFSTSFPIPICVQTTDNHHEKSIRKSECVGSFYIYVDIIWPFFDNLFTSLWTFLTLIVDTNRHFWTSYPPHFVHVVIERPQKCPFETWTHPIYCMWSARLSPHAFMYVLYYPYYVYSNSFVLYYILEQLLDPLRSNILIHMYSIVDILGYPWFFLLVP